VNIKIRGILSLVAIGLSACETAVPAPPVVVRDSAGLRIVESMGPVRFAAPLSVGPPTFSVGSVEGAAPYLLSRVVGAMQLPNGDIVVGNGATNELRFYDASGDFIRSEGREGEGPGEYAYLRALGRCREAGFIAFDLNWQMNAYDEEGRFVERTTLRAPDGISPYNVACDPEGRILILGWGRAAMQGPQVGFYESRDRLVLTSATGEIDTEFGEWLVSERIGALTGSRPHPAGRATVLAIHDGTVYAGSGERFEIATYDLDGTPRGIARGAGAPLPVTDSVKQAYLELQLERAQPERQASIRREMAGWEWPTSLPAYTALRVDPHGIAWLRDFRLDPDEAETWRLLHPVEGYLGDVPLAAGASLLDVGADHLLVLRRDALGVESVQRLPLTRGEAP
jgi:hypothetical protein